MSNKFNKSVWSFKKINDDDLSNKYDELLLTIDEKSNYELNVNKFYSQFNIDPDTFFDDQNTDKKEITDDVYSSTYHHSLIIGIAEYNAETNILRLNINKIFTNEENKLDDSIKNIEFTYDNNNDEIILSKSSKIAEILMITEDIHLKYLKK